MAASSASTSPAIGQVQPPQARDRVFGAPGAKQRHPPSVPRYCYLARNAEREAPGAGQLPGQVVDRHASTLRGGLFGARLVNRQGGDGWSAGVTRNRSVLTLERLRELRQYLGMEE